MRIKPPSGGPPPLDQASQAAETARAGAPEAAASVAAPESAGPVSGPAKAAGSAATDPVGDVARRLRSGDLSAREAVELLIDDAVERQVGKATADRESLARELKDLLRRYTETDPYLASKVRRLSGTQK